MSEHWQTGPWFQRPASSWTDEEQLLAHGAAIVAEKRAAVFAELGFTVSAGLPLCTTFVSA